MSVPPFLATSASPIQPLGRVLRAVDTPGTVSPWSPAAASTPEPACEPIDVEAMRAEAREQARREIAEARDRLHALIDELEATKAALVAPIAELIAETAVTVIQAWLQATDRRETFAPLIRAWLARQQTAATAVVHPDDVEALRSVVGDEPIAIAADAARPRGSLVIRSGAFELAHCVEARLHELRDVIAAAIGGTP